MDTKYVSTTTPAARGVVGRHGRADRADPRRWRAPMALARRRPGAAVRARAGDPTLCRRRATADRGSIPRRAQADRLGVLCNLLTRRRSFLTSFATSGSVILLSNLSQLTRARSLVARFGRHAFGIIDNIALVKRSRGTIVLRQPFAEVVGPSFPLPICWTISFHNFSILASGAMNRSAVVCRTEAP